MYHLISKFMTLYCLPMYQNYNNTRPFGSGPHYYYVPSTDLDSTHTHTLTTLPTLVCIASLYHTVWLYVVGIVILVLHTKVGVLLLYLVFEAVVGLYMERCTLMLETAGEVLVRGRRKRGRGGRKEVVEQACGRPTACVSALTAAARRGRSSRSRVVAAPFCTACRDPPPLPLLAFGVGKKNPRLVVLGGYLLHTHTYSLAYIVL